MKNTQAEVFNKIKNNKMKNLKLARVLLFIVCIGFAQVGFGQADVTEVSDCEANMDISELGWWVFFDDIDVSNPTAPIPASVRFDIDISSPSYAYAIRFDFKVSNSNANQGLDFEAFDYSDYGYSSLGGGWYHYCSDAYPSYAPFDVTGNGDAGYSILNDGPIIVLPGGAQTALGGGGAIDLLEDETDLEYPANIYFEILDEMVNCRQGYEIEIENIRYSTKQTSTCESWGRSSKGECINDVSATFEITDCNVTINNGSGRLGQFEDQFSMIYSNELQLLKLSPIKEAIEATTLTIVSVNGIQVSSQELSNNNHNINLADLQTGIYYAIIQSGEKSQHLKMLVK